MAISFTCSECDADLKVKDALAGRKIKCPHCEETVVVPAGDDDDGAVTAAPPRKAARRTEEKETLRPQKKGRPAAADDDEEEDEEEEEEETKKEKKKSKKKKKQGSSGQIIALAAGGGLLLIAIVASLIFLLPGRGNKQAQNTPPPEEKKEPPKKEEPKKEEKQDPKLPPKKKESALTRQRDLIEFRNHFNQVGIAYQDIVASTGKGPKNKEDLTRHLKGARDIVDNIEKGYIQFIYNVNPNNFPDGASNTIVGYEPYWDPTGQILVIMGDGKVQMLRSDQYLQTPKAKGN